MTEKRKEENENNKKSLEDGDKTFFKIFTPMLGLLVLCCLVTNTINGARPRRVYEIDVNNDNRMDIVVDSYFQRSIFIKNSDGSYTSLEDSYKQERASGTFSQSKYDSIRQNADSLDDVAEGGSQ